MAHTYPSININADTFGTHYSKINNIINAVATEVLTANNLANGAVTTGNSFLNGIFGANTVTASHIRGGNVQASAPMYIDSNTTINALANFTIGNSSVNTFANSSYLDVITADITTANIVTGVIQIGTINSIAGNVASWGNTTVNVIANGTILAVQTTTTSATLKSGFMTVGNSTVNATINSTAISFSNSSGSFSLDAAGSVSNTEYNSRFKFANLTLTGTSTQNVDSFAVTDYKTCEYVVSIKDNGANAFQHSTLLVAFDGSATTAFSTEYATFISNVSLGLFSAIANATHVILQFTPTPASTSVSYGRTGVNV